MRPFPIADYAELARRAESASGSVSAILAFRDALETAHPFFINWPYPGYEDDARAYVAASAVLMRLMRGRNLIRDCKSYAMTRQREYYRNPLMDLPSSENARGLFEFEATECDNTWEARYGRDETRPCEAGGKQSGRLLGRQCYAVRAAVWREDGMELEDVERVRQHLDFALIGYDEQTGAKHAFELPMNSGMRGLCGEVALKNLWSDRGIVHARVTGDAGYCWPGNAAFGFDAAYRLNGGNLEPVEEVVVGYH